MSQGSSTFGIWLLKWVVVPFGLAGAGFFFVGPRIGDNLVSRANIPASSTGDVQAEGESSHKGEPKISITSKPAPPESKPASTRRRSRTAPKPENRVEVVPEVSPEPTEPEPGPTEPAETNPDGEPPSDGN